MLGPGVGGRAINCTGNGTGTGIDLQIGGQTGGGPCGNIRTYRNGEARLNGQGNSRVYGNQ